MAVSKKYLKGGVPPNKGHKLLQISLLIKISKKSHTLTIYPLIISNKQLLLNKLNLADLFPEWEGG